MHHASLHIDTYCVIHACIYSYWRKIEVKRRKTIAVITMVAIGCWLVIIHRWITVLLVSFIVFVHFI